MRPSKTGERELAIQKAFGLKSNTHSGHSEDMERDYSDGKHSPKKRKDHTMLHGIPNSSKKNGSTRLPTIWAITSTSKKK